MALNFNLLENGWNTKDTYSEEENTGYEEEEDSQESDAKETSYIAICIISSFQTPCVQIKQ